MREKTLTEWCETLPESHLANRELKELQEKYQKAVNLLMDAKDKNHVAYIILEELGEI